jgi:hypothetical protein
MSIHHKCADGLTPQRCMGKLVRAHARRQPRAPRPELLPAPMSSLPPTPSLQPWKHSESLAYPLGFLSGTMIEQKRSYFDSIEKWPTLKQSGSLMVSYFSSWDFLSFSTAGPLYWHCFGFQNEIHAYLEPPLPPANKVTGYLVLSLSGCQGC